MNACERSRLVLPGAGTTLRASPVAIEGREAKFREDPDEPAGERRRPRLRAVPAEHRLEHLTLGSARRAKCAVDGGQGFAQGVLPFVYLLSKA